MTQISTPLQASGILLVDKPAGVTSHDVVQVIRRRLGIRRIGHAGTLDPMAQGLLVVLVGSTTKTQQLLQGHDKVYEAVIRLGIKTDSADAYGNIIDTRAVPKLDRQAVEKCLESFKGVIAQTPPLFSAVKVQGHPAYWWARRKQKVVLASRNVQVHDITLLEMSADTLTLRVHCSSGTYIRTLAESIAEKLKTTGHLVLLIRRQSGRWHLRESKPLSWYASASHSDILACRLDL